MCLPDRIALEPLLMGGIAVLKAGILAGTQGSTPWLYASIGALIAAFI